ncbi:hypothetical protein KJ059_14820 [Myxococcota bacterium]|nr:hypothetical protein [Myxococcota bacterium]MCZ7620583.1 hypothetical protein [Myxococcota bacterium]
MIPRGWFPPLLLLLSLGLGNTCGQPVIVSVTPTEGTIIATPSFPVEVVLGGAAQPGTLEVTLNGVELVLTGGPTVFSATLAPGPPLLDDNELSVSAGATNGTTWRRVIEFSYGPPKARARRIESEGDRIQGPLGHSRLGDWLLVNDVARFAVQDAPQRDLHSVGQFGGNLIDAELIGRENRDAFFELQPAINVETVLNAQFVEVVNDGQDGTAAILRACGPDDLIDYINASSQLSSLGLSLPNLLAAADDRDYAVEACTEYRLEPGDRHIELETIVSNLAPAPIRQYAGYYINAMGTVEQFVQAGGVPMGLGEPLLSPITEILGFFGFDSSEGIDYGLIPIAFPGGQPSSSSFSTSGVSFLMHSQNLVFVLGADLPAIFVVPGNGSKAFRSFFSVGDGSAGNSSRVEAEVKGVGTGTIEGCVTIGGAPAPAARVAVGPLGGGRISTLAAHFVTDAAGCYRGQLRAGTYGVAASRVGVPYEGGGLAPVYHTAVVPLGGVVIQDIALPATGRVQVTVTDESGAAVPARVNVIGAVSVTTASDPRFGTSDPSPDPLFVLSVLSAQDTRTGMFDDQTDRLLPGYASLAYAGPDGVAEFDLEPGTYQVVVSRGDEYSVYQETIAPVAGATTSVSAQIGRVLDTAGFVSSDFHVHMLNSPDSRVALETRARSFAAEGVENIVATDHDAITDLAPTIVASGLAPFLTTTIGEEITSFDYGHYNAYPQGLDPTRVSNGSTDWGGAAPPGEDFPSFGHYVRTPAQIEAEALGKPQNAGLETVVQINHIGSHFSPLRIDTGVEPPQSFLPDTSVFRLDPAVANFFHPFPALELWNGNNNSHQNQFLIERIGIWMNLLNQGYRATAVASTDTHTVLNLDSAGARSWTPSSTDVPAAIPSAEIGQAVKSQRLVGGQGLYVQTRLVAGSASADFGLGNSTLVTTNTGSVDLEIRIQAPLWAPYDQIEIYRNAQTVVTGTTGGTPTSYSAVPTQVLTLGGGDFTRATIDVHPAVPGAERYETNLVVPLTGLTEDEWVVVVARGTVGESTPMFPIYGSNLSVAGNLTLANLMAVDAAESGVRALGFTNALYVDVDGNGVFDAPGVRVAP